MLLSPKYEHAQVAATKFSQATVWDSVPQCVLDSSAIRHVGSYIYVLFSFRRSTLLVNTFARCCRFASMSKYVARLQRLTCIWSIAHSFVVTWKCFGAVKA